MKNMALWRRGGLLLAAFACIAGSAIAAEKQLIYIDLQPRANHKLAEQFHADEFPGNNLAELPKGEQTFEGCKFKIGEGLIQLGSNLLASKPKEVKGIKVDKTFAKLHILHATGWSVEDGTRIGEYTVNYEDKTKEVIPIVYGSDVRDWWVNDPSQTVSRGKVGWKGKNGAHDMIWLYITSWNNPKPDKKIASIDYAAVGGTDAAPFCVAMTAEGK